MSMSSSLGKQSVTLRIFVIAAAAALTTGFDCGSSGGGSGINGVAQTTTWTNPSGTAKVVVTASPLSFSIQDANGNVLLESAGITDDPTYGSLAYTHNVDQTARTIVYGWDYYRGTDNPFQKMTLDGVSIEVAQGSITGVIGPNGSGK